MNIMKGNARVTMKYRITKKEKEQGLFVFCRPPSPKPRGLSKYLLIDGDGFCCCNQNKSSGFNQNI